MEEGILDLNIPMNYKREFCVVGNESPPCFGLPQEAQYESWNEFTMDHQYDRQAAIGSALYLNSIGDSVTQVREALVDSSAGNPIHGWVGYSYRTPDALTNAGQRPGDESRAELTRALTQPSEYDAMIPPVFQEPAAVPVRPWLAQPATGHVLGNLVASDGTPLDQARVELRDTETDALLATAVTDGSGWFGFVDLAPGRYKAMVEGPDGDGRRATTFGVSAGEVTEVQIIPRGR